VWKTSKADVATSLLEIPNLNQGRRSDSIKNTDSYTTRRRKAGKPTNPKNRKEPQIVVEEESAAPAEKSEI